MSIPKEELHRLIDALPKEKTDKARAFLESLIHQDRGLPDVERIARDPVIRQIKASRRDREQGHIYSGEKGLEVLREEIQEYERKSNVYYPMIKKRLTNFSWDGSLST